MSLRSAMRAGFVGGSIAGALDITYAMAFTAFHGVDPLIVLQSVASGAMGRAAFECGLTSQLSGLALHLLLSYAWSAVLLLCAWRHPALVRNVMQASVALGILVYLIMHFVVVPLSAYPDRWHTRH